MPRIVFAWLSLIIYSIIALIFSFPILEGGDAVLVGGDDAGLSLWATWWFPHALARNYDVVFNNYAVFPVESNYLTLLSLPTSVFYALLRPIFGAVGGYNMLIPVYSALNAFFTFLFLRNRLSKDHWQQAILAFSGGLILAFGVVTYTIASHSQIPLLGFWVIPLSLLVWEFFADRPSVFRAVVLAGGLYLVVVMSVQYWNLVVTVILPYIGYRIWMTGNWRELQSHLGWGVLVFGLLFFVYPATPYIWTSYGLFYAPTGVWQGMDLPISPPRLILQVVGLLLVVVVARRIKIATREIQFFLIWIGLLFLWSWIPGWAPLSIVNHLLSVPHLTQLTQSALFSITPLFVSVWFVLAHWQAIAIPAQHIVGNIALISLVLLSGWWQPLPTIDVPHYEVYQQIANDPEDYVIAHFPLGVDTLARRYFADLPERDAADERAEKVRLENLFAQYDRFGLFPQAGQIMASVPLHGKRVLGGLVPENQAGNLAIYREAPLLRLLAMEGVAGEPEDVIQAIRRDSARWRIGYILLHSDQVEPYQIAEMRSWLTASGVFCFLGGEGGLEIWQATWHPDGCAVSVDIGTGDAELLLGENWYDAEQWGELTVRWAGREERSEIKLYTIPGRDHILRLRLSSPQIAEQSVAVSVNGEVVGEFDIGADWEEVEISVGGELLRDEQVVIAFQHEQGADVEGRRLTVVYDWLEWQEPE